MNLIIKENPSLYNILLYEIILEAMNLFIK